MSLLNLRSDDDHVRRLIQDATVRATRLHVSTVSCAIVGSQCSRIHVVPVPVHRGFELAPRPFDLETTVYLEQYHTQNPLVTDLDDYLLQSPALPDDVDRHQWTIFRSLHPVAGVNRLVQSFPRAHLIPFTVRGSCLVIKSNPAGVVEDIMDVDFPHIMDAVVNAFI